MARGEVVGSAADAAPSLQALLEHLVRLRAHGDALAAWHLTKCYGELAMAAYYVAAWLQERALPSQPFAAEVAAWRMSLIRYLQRSDSATRMALRARQRGVYHLQPYLWTRAAGQRISWYEATMVQLARAGLRADSIGEYHCMWKAGVVRGELDWSRALGRWLSVWGDDKAAWRHSAYRITHAAFYLTDFGSHAPRAAPADLGRLAGIAEYLLTAAVDRAHWDLVCELLMALQCLRRDATTRSHEALRQFSVARGSDGPAGCLRSYHTAVVDVMRCALTQRRAPDTTTPQGDDHG